jgi:hypothetical protein
MSHDEVSKRWHETNHTDPVAYFAQYGKTVDAFRREVQEVLDMNPEFDEYIKVLKDNEIIDADSNHKPEEPVTWFALAKVIAKIIKLIIK